MKSGLRRAKDSLVSLRFRAKRISQRADDTKEEDAPKPLTVPDPTAVDILRYRYHHGTNLGSVFVLEKWLSPSMFPEGWRGSSELEAAKAWVSSIGPEAARQKFNDHWRSAVTDSDIEWLIKVAKCTTVRIPIGYFDLGEGLIRDTPFEPYHYIYDNAWDQIQQLVTRLRARSIGVLIDLHALPGGANAQEHSGTNSGEAQLWYSAKEQKRWIRCCQILAERVRNSGMEVAGIQIINEAQWEAPSMYKLYDECLAVISAVDSSIPVIVSDAWNLDKAIDYAQSKNFLHQTASACPVVIDTHYYWAFSDEDKRKSPQEIIAEVQTKLSELDGREGDVSGRGAVQTIVGEYSCVLTEESWARSGGIPKGELVMQFGHEQSKRWQARSGGSFFWTWKMDWHPGGEWGFTAQTTNKAIMPPPMRTLSSEQIQKILETARRCEGEFCNQAFQQHVDYWKSTASAMWRYKEGWMRGYRDAMIFFEGRADDAISGANKIGNLEIWILKRLREFGDRSEFVWHFEHGLRRGIRDFYAILGE